mmetsp:Transcript_6501/g.18216  ORF Transcript_6501/g.18216 Transcript_6501/m.18216 type:complete len:316 (-) Transcript_6501:602-1549(-)
MHIGDAINHIFTKLLSESSLRIPRDELQCLLDYSASVCLDGQLVHTPLKLLDHLPALLHCHCVQELLHDEVPECVTRQFRNLWQYHIEDRFLLGWGRLVPLCLKETAPVLVLRELDHMRFDFREAERAVCTMLPDLPQGRTATRHIGAVLGRGLALRPCSPPLAFGLRFWHVREKTQLLDCSWCSRMRENARNHRNWRQRGPQRSHLGLCKSGCLGTPRPRLAQTGRQRRTERGKNRREWKNRTTVVWWRWLAPLWPPVDTVSLRGGSSIKAHSSQRYFHRSFRSCHRGADLALWLLNWIEKREPLGGRKFRREL